MEKEKIINKKKTMFQSTNKQALEAIKKLQEKGKIKSVGTNRNYLVALCNGLINLDTKIAL